ncbi:MAG TPA: pyridoxal-phosphate dependent enzyme, partial [Chitinophagaceae bacterium]|nr:pyridoxal-phosphate dependent enzyme [Chitinophagaceae bacterium]
MQPLSFESITVEEIDLAILHEKKMKCSVLRIDKIHPIISGNKWFKLKYYLLKAKNGGIDGLVTFGGAYSNHIIATAAAGELFALHTIGIIRGERPKEFSSTLLQAMDLGMELIFVSRQDYRNKEVPMSIARQRPTLLINEGGYGIEGAKGSAEILDYCTKKNYSHIACAVGTSTMMAGLIKASITDQEVIGIPVLKDEASLDKALLELLSPQEKKKRFRMVHEYHFGGYAKRNDELLHFMNQFYRDTVVPTDFVYT